MNRLIMLCMAAVLIVASGCVSTKTYKEALSESEARKVRAEETATELETTAGELERAKAEVAALTETSAVQVDEITSLRARTDFLEREVDRLGIKAGELSKEKEEEIANLRMTYDDLVHEMKSEIEHGDIKITQAVDKLSVNFVEKILFDSGSAEIKPRGLEILTRVGDILKKVADRQVRVEGHTDDVPIGPRIIHKFPTNWELSTARATTVVRYLQNSVGIAPELLSAAGYSEYRPVAGNDTEEGKSQNRRIEIVLLPLDVDRVLQELKQ